MATGLSVFINGLWRTIVPPTVPGTTDPVPGGDGGGGTGIAAYCFHSAAEGEDPQTNVTSARTAFLPWKELWIPLSGAISARACTYLGNGTPGPAGSKLAFEYHDGTTWQPMGAAGDVFIALDQAADVAIKGDWIKLLTELGDVRVRMVREGGDDSTGLFHGEIYLEVQYGSATPTPPTNPCEALISTDWNVFADWAAAQSDGWTLLDPDGVVTAVAIDSTHTLNHAKSLHVSVTGDGGGTIDSPRTWAIYKATTVPEGSYSQTDAIFATGDVSTQPENAWVSSTGVGPSTGTTLNVIGASGTVAGTSVYEAWYDGVTVIPECAGGAPPGDPADPPAVTGGAFGIYNGPGIPDNVNPFNAYILNITPGNYTSQLNQARTLGHKVMIQPSLPRNNWTNGNGTFNEGMYNAIVDSWSGIDLSSWSDVIIGNHVIDEPYCSNCFGGSAIPSEVVNRIAGRWKALPGWSWMLTYIRVDAIRMEGSSLPNVDGCWNQYLARLGTVQNYISSQGASAARQGKRIVWGMNIKDGGNGTSGIQGTSGNDADSGNNVRWEMTALEVLTYGLALAEAGGDALFCWRYDLPLLGRRDMSSSLSAVAARVAELAA